MVTINRTWDMRLVRQAITHPRVYPMATDDSSPDASAFQPVEHDSIVYLRADDGETFGGIFMLVPVNGVTFEIHTCLMPCMWGHRAQQAALSVVSWVWNSTDALRLITQAPKDNPLARRLAEHAGMVLYGTNPHSYMRRGQLIDIDLLGVSKGDICQ